MTNIDRDFPSPADRQGVATVIYDGNCRMCRSQVQRLANWDRWHRLAFLPLQDPEVATRFPDLTTEQLMTEMHVIEPGGRRHGGAAAFRYLSRQLPRLWPLAPLLHIPFSLPLWQWCYRLIARQRYRWGRVSECSDEACRVHFGR